MSLALLLSDSCTIMKRSVSQGKTDAESWADGQTVKCRILKQTITPRSDKSTQRSTVIRTRFVLLKGADVAIRDRIRHQGRAYDVIEVTTTMERRGAYHKVAVCEGVAGSV